MDLDTGSRLSDALISGEMLYIPRTEGSEPIRTQWIPLKLGGYWMNCVRT